MSWLFSRALVEAFSGASSSDGEPCAPLSVMPTLHKFYRLDKMMEPLNLSRFGLTCAVLTEDRGEELLMSFLAGFPARTLAPRERAPGLGGVDPVSGLSLPESLAKFDPSSSSWRIAPSLLAEVSDEFSGTWPRWGTMRNGVCWALKMSAPPINETVYGFWPTPRASDGSHGGPNQRGSKGDLMLSSAVHVFPTPTASNTKAFHMRGADKGKPRAARSYLPTPMASDAKGVLKHGPREGNDSLLKTGRELDGQSGGQLNPPWVEWLMKWPIGWTDLRPLAMASFQKWPNSHSTLSNIA